MEIKINCRVTTVHLGHHAQIDAVYAETKHVFLDGMRGRRHDHVATAKYTECKTLFCSKVTPLLSPEQVCKYMHVANDIPPPPPNKPIAI